MPHLWTQEPARLLGYLTAFVTGVIDLLVVFGVDLTNDQRNAILRLILPTIALIIMTTEFIRSRVYSPATVYRLTEGAHGESPDE